MKRTSEPGLLVAGSLLLAALATGVGCHTKTAGLGATCIGDCACAGDTCSCKAGGTCSFGVIPAAADGAAGTPAGVPPTSSVANDVTYSCESQNQCDVTCGSGCTNSCDGRSTCAGTCTANCTSSCGGSSQCTLSTGVDSQVTCAGGSTCKITLDKGSTLTCAGESTCNVACPNGGCTIECGGTASCTVACGAAAACAIQCNGMRAQDCPAGMTCTNPCAGPASKGSDAGAHDDARGRP